MSSLISFTESESEVAQSCPTLCDSMDCRLPDFFVHGILQARVLEWVVISFSRGSSLPSNQTGVSCIESEVMKLLSRVRLFAIPWTVVYQASLSTGFSRQGYWSGLSFPSPGNLPSPETELRSPSLQVDSVLSDPPGKP